MAINFDDLKKRANELAQQAAELAQQGANRSRQLATIAKLKAANLGEEDTIRKAYAELGRIYFAKYGEHPEDEFAAACDTIVEAQAAIAANNATIEEMNAQKEPDVEVEIVEMEEAAEETGEAGETCECDKTDEPCECEKPAEDDKPCECTCEKAEESGEDAPEEE